ncbi:hypothetical protein CAC42_3329 [Sphaceloma murrayae]|uniref:Uncharacterized protein n=1 Tax=Sphaceloma murrayae TaxID=2082308 RepID=A0A2K1R112_9PEZI|nr:hypothetical protein CAC42_3329 [Sphaceloma murrayae]
MSAVIVKGIIISLSLAAAVGIALQSPEVKEWLEEQRRKLAELLRTMSEGLDPQTRREAEAFAYEGQMPSPREMQGMHNAAAVATGRDAEDTAARRLTRQSSTNPIDAEERRRLGREYLARRNQELLDIKNKRNPDKGEATQETGVVNATDTVANREKSGSVGSFDHLVTDDGSLRIDEKRLLPASDVQSELPAYQALETPAKVPVAISALQAGSAFANPFADEFAMSDTMDFGRSSTPKPPVPPKIALGDETPAASASPPMTNVEDPSEQAPEDEEQDFSYEEQLARALSISLAENEASTQRTIRRTLTEQEAFERAIEESLKDAQKSTPVPEPALSPKGPLVDFSSDVTAPTSSNNPFRQHRPDEDEDLYYLTPSTTGVRPNDGSSSIPQVRSTAQYPNMAEFLEAFQSAPSQTREYDFPDVPTGSLTAGSPSVETPRHEDLALPAEAIQPTSPTTATLSPSLPPQDALSTGYHTESETDDFASLPDSTAQSEGSLVEVEDVDIDSMSDEEDDGIHTPRSWSEIGSDVGDSERSESETGDLVHL